MISTPCEALCVDLVGPYTLKGKDGSSIDFMALTMINPASSWYEIVELPTIYRLITKKENGKERTIKEEIFDESSDLIAQLVNKIWLCRYLPLCNSYGIKRKPTTIKNPQVNAICERVHQVLE